MQTVETTTSSPNSTNAVLAAVPLWLCIYQYKGMETEGHLQSDELMIVRAVDDIEALYKYHVWLRWREGRLKDIYYKSLSEYRKSEYASGGWGFCAYKIDDCNEKRRDDSPAFMSVYEQYCR